MCAFPAGDYAMHLDRKVAGTVIDYALSLGADFCDLFLENTRTQNLRVKNEIVESVNQGIDFGVGIRLIYGTEVLYGHSNSVDQDELIRITKILGDRYHSDRVTNLKAFKPLEAENIHPIKKGLDLSPFTEEKIAFLKKVSSHATNTSPLVQVSEASLIQWHQYVQIYNSHGLEAQDNRHYCRILSNVIAEKNGEQSTGYYAPGVLQGWEFNESLNPKEMAEISSAQALVKLDAAPCPGGKMPVIIGNGFGGVIFHEACGHLLETTSVQKKSSVFWDKMGEQIAHSAVNAVDDGTIANAWGSINIDDEGMKTQKTQLIKEGKLTNFLCDYVGSLKTDYKPTGSGRRQSYKFAPASRMRNTYIEPGHYQLEEMVETVDRGIFCKAMGGGSVSPGTGEFNFAALESYLIENGKITTPLKGATLIGTGPDVLGKISMVGNDLELAAGMCGSVSGSIPTTVGQPAIKVDEILVGGQ